MPENILEIKGLRKTYPGVVALNHFDLNIRKGEIHALVGENGAGKSTLIKSITGAVIPDEGTITFDGKSYSHLTPKLSSSIGIGVIYQEFNLVPALTVSENIFLGNYSGNGTFVDFKDMNGKAEEALKRIGIELSVSMPVWKLSVGHQQIVEILRSLVKDIKFLIMDEPTAPLTTNEVEQLISIVNTLKEQGITILYISHRLEEVFRICDRVTVMRDGEYITTMNVAETNMKELISSMVGRELTRSFPDRGKSEGKEVLRVENLTGNGVRNISFTLHKGEVLGFAGLLGCGRTETIQMIFGAAKKTGGRIYLFGKETDVVNTKQAMTLGIGLIPEDRKRQGVFLRMTIGWNTTLSALKKKLLVSKIFVDEKKEKSIVGEYFTKLRVKAPSAEQLVGNLSGGNQQKVAIAKVLAADVDIMIFDEPTRGIDVGAKQEIYNLIHELVDEGKSVLLISSEMEEVMGMSDRIVVLCEGEFMGELQRKDFDQERILTLASGIQS